LQRVDSQRVAFFVVFSLNQLNAFTQSTQCFYPSKGMLSFNKTHAFIDRKAQKTSKNVKELYFLPITHPSNLLTNRHKRF